MGQAFFFLIVISISSLIQLKNLPMQIQEITVKIKVGGHFLPISYWIRPGERRPIVYLHGLGSSKDDFRCAASWPPLAKHRLVAVDWPGCGLTPYPSGTLTVDDLVQMLGDVLDALRLLTPIVAGHSLGGLAALLLAQRSKKRIGGFVNVEGNLAPEDCIFSREAARTAPSYFTGGQFFTSFKASLLRSGKAGFVEYAHALRRNAEERAFRDYSVSIVQYSDTEPLLSWFLALTIPKLFVYGAENRHLSYLPRLREGNAPIAEIPDSNHFPLTSNPRAFLEILTMFIVSNQRHTGFE
jgi:pimeloyl-ACP methyl ester carboxylesterase